VEGSNVLKNPYMPPSEHRPRTQHPTPAQCFGLGF
jgi:hypothetical protein